MKMIETMGSHENAAFLKDMSQLCGDTAPFELRLRGHFEGPWVVGPLLWLLGS